MSKRDKPLTIVKFEAKNVKRIRAVQIEPDPEKNVVLLTGRNRQGKSSILEVMFWALAGKREMPSRPIRQGEKEGSVTLDLGEYVVDLKITENGSYLKVRSRDGFAAPSPQTFLASRLGGYAANPLEFLRLKPDEQVKALQSLIDVKFDPQEFETVSGLSLKKLMSNSILKSLRLFPGFHSKVKLDDPIALIDQAYKHIFEKRTETNKEVTRLEGAAKTEKALIPAGKENVEKVSATALMQERSGLEAIKSANDALRAELKSFTERLKLQAQAVFDDRTRENQALRNRVPELEKLRAERVKLIGEYDEEIMRLNKKLAELHTARDEMKEKHHETNVELDKVRLAVVALEEPNLDDIYPTIVALTPSYEEMQSKVEALQDPDFTDIDARIAAADETNEIAGHVEQHKTHLADLEKAKQTSSELSSRLDAIKQHKGKLIVEAGLPVEGLGFEDGEVTYKGLPLSQASGADQIEISCAIAMAGHPEIGILTIDVGWSELDSESKTVLVEWAKRTGTQIWSVKVSDEPGEEGFYIDDGTVAAIDGEPVGPQMLAAEPEELVADKIPF